MASESYDDKQNPTSMGGDILTLLDERMRHVAKETFAALAESGCQHNRDGAVEELRSKIARVRARAKEFISVMAAALLLGCSDGHIRNLVRKAKKGEARSPIPFRDLDGVVVFKLDDLLAWSEQPKQRLRASEQALPRSKALRIHSSALLQGRDSREGASHDQEAW